LPACFFLSVVLNRGGQARSYDVESLRVQGSARVLKLRGVDSIGAAEALAGAEIQVPDEAAPPLEEGRYLVADLIGCAVRTVSGEDLGAVVDVWEAGGAATLVVERPDGRELLLPFSARLVPEIDPARKSIVVDPPDGLLDLNEI